MRKWLLLFVGLLALLIPAAVSLTQDTVTLEISGVNPSELPDLTVTVNVLDGNSRPVPNLTVDDFTVGGDLPAEVIRVENVAINDLPFATVLVIDTSTSMSGRPIANAKAAAQQFIESVGDNDLIAIVTFNSRATLVQDYTADKDQLSRVVDGLEIGGNTALYDAGLLGVEVAANAPVPRRAVVLLSDGAEYGGASQVGRSAALEQAGIRGVSMYTIGLGFGIDRTYLQELARGTNARNYESPSPEELTGIYSELADLFRTQYIVTLNSDVPLDGTEYTLTLQAQNSNVDDAIVRAPIPVPIVSINTPAGSISQPYTFTPEVRADDEITSVEYFFNDEAVTADNGSFTVDPVQLAPEEYTLSVRVTDVDGDVGEASGAFTVAAIAPDVVVNWDASAPITTPQLITLTTSGQTPVVEATYIIRNSEGFRIESTTDNAAEDFVMGLDPFLLAMGDYRLTIEALSESGATSRSSFDFAVGAVSPRNLEITGIDDGDAIASDVRLGLQANLQEGAQATDFVFSFTDGREFPADLILRPRDMTPGDATIEVNLTDSNGATNTQQVSVTIPTFPPEVTLGALPEVLTESTVLTVTAISQTPITSIAYQIDNGDFAPLSGNEILLDIDAIGGGDHRVTVMVSNEGGESNTASRNFTVVPPTPTPTFTPTFTPTPLPTATPTIDVTATAAIEMTSAAQAVEATAMAQVTLDMQATVDTQATLDSDATAVAQSTLDAQATLDSDATTVAQSTVDAQATLDSDATTIAQSTLDARATLGTQLERTAVARDMATQNVEATAAQIALDNQATIDVNVQATATAMIIQATTDAQATIDTENATEEPTEEPTEVSASVTEEATAEATEAVTEEVTDVVDVTEAVTEEATEAVVASNTPEPSVEPTNTDVQPSPTQVEIVDEGAQPSSLQGDSQGLLLIVGGALLLLVLLLIFFFGRRRS